MLMRPALGWDFFSLHYSKLIDNELFLVQCALKIVSFFALLHKSSRNQQETYMFVCSFVCFKAYDAVARVRVRFRSGATCGLSLLLVLALHRGFSLKVLGFAHSTKTNNSNCYSTRREDAHENEGFLSKLCYLCFVRYLNRIVVSHDRKSVVLVLLCCQLSLIWLFCFCLFCFVVFSFHSSSLLLLSLCD